MGNGLITIQSCKLHQAQVYCNFSCVKIRCDRLVKMQGLELAVPGTYMAGTPVVTIAAFAPQLTVITSKQRPRKLTIHGSDGAEYMFLLKVSLQSCSLQGHHGHHYQQEDLIPKLRILQML